jgi:prepilin-type N-terminal cleavage/methylation domain-containing protein
MRMRRMRGFSLLELVVVIVAIAILAGLLLDRVLPLIGQAERVAFLQTRQQLQSALVLEAAERVARGESRTIASLAGANPMDLLLEPPGNYVGERGSASAGELPRRSWFFDPQHHWLVYLPGREARFDPQDGPPDRIELAVRFVYRDRNGDGAYDASIDHFDGLRLESVHDFSWPN